MLEVSRSGYYKWRTTETSQREQRKAQIMERISFHFKDKQSKYGSPKIAGLLHLEGFNVTVRTVSIYMKQMGLRARRSKTFEESTTDPLQD
ncbi:IS3 family transposase [Paenibacillus eucommiae]|uniref:Transposase InsO family protein n=1 Tax=Paenibacillus eucommiae TaxID=1355755 RepID=A0ABS4IPK3_9BACL|nr:IS3 family transposase [Paenibacillus eucommiae]MBP1989095.1 transposase InsO family protein [Paenibacillus eucommiae]